MIHLFPGLGVTKAMYQGDWRSLSDVVFHDWPKGRDVSSIEELAAYFIEEYGIEENDYVAGTSMGGIVACEIANQVNVRGVILVSSAIEPSEINGALSALHRIIDLAPIELAQFTASNLNNGLVQMFGQSEPAFIREMCKAIFRWKGLRYQGPTFRIHGSRDLVIPLPSDTDVVLEGGHLVAIEKPRQCVDALKRFLLARPA